MHTAVLRPNCSSNFELACRTSPPTVKPKGLRRALLLMASLTACSRTAQLSIVSRSLRRGMFPAGSSFFHRFIVGTQLQRTTAGERHCDPCFFNARGRQLMPVDNISESQPFYPIPDQRCTQFDRGLQVAVASGEEPYYSNAVEHRQRHMTPPLEYQFCPSVATSSVFETLATFTNIRTHQG